MLPKIPLEHLKISKLICGTNNFVGINHRLDFIYGPYYFHKFRKIERITEILEYLLDKGVNAIISSPRIRIYNAIQLIQKEKGVKIHWICSPSTRKTVKGLEMDIFKQIEWCADHEVSICIPHRNYTDFALDKNTLKIKGLNPIVEYIRDKNMIPGLSCHYHQVIKAVENNKYDIKIIIQPYNQIGFMSDTSPECLKNIIQNTKISILNIKPLAAGRLNPYQAIPFCLKSIKENDFISVGTNKLSQSQEVISIFEDFYKRKS